MEQGKDMTVKSHQQSAQERAKRERMGGWLCLVCEYMNRPSIAAVQRCHTCGSVRGSLPESMDEEKVESKQEPEEKEKEEEEKEMKSAGEEMDIAPTSAASTEQMDTEKEETNKAVEEKNEEQQTQPLPREEELKQEITEEKQNIVEEEQHPKEEERNGEEEETKWMDMIAMAEEQEQQQATGYWSCHACTFINDPSDRDQCAVCLTPRRFVWDEVQTRFALAKEEEEEEEEEGREKQVGNVKEEKKEEIQKQEKVEQEEMEKMQREEEPVKEVKGEGNKSEEKMEAEKTNDEKVDAERMEVEGPKTEKINENVNEETNQLPSGNETSSLTKQNCEEREKDNEEKEKKQDKQMQTSSNNKSNKEAALKAAFDEWRAQTNETELQWINLKATSSSCKLELRYGTEEVLLTIPCNPEEEEEEEEEESIFFVESKSMNVWTNDLNERLLDEVEEGRRRAVHERFPAVLDMLLRAIKRGRRVAALMLSKSNEGIATTSTSASPSKGKEGKRKRKKHDEEKTKEEEEEEGGEEEEEEEAYDQDSLRCSTSGLSLEDESERLDWFQQLKNKMEEEGTDFQTSLLGTQSNSYLIMLAAELKAAQDLCGPHQVRACDRSSVVITVDIVDVISSETCLALDLTKEEPIVITMEFARMLFCSSSGQDDKPPIPTFTTRQWTTSDKNSFGVKYHVKEIISRYIEDNWKWADTSKRLKLVHPTAFNADPSPKSLAEGSQRRNNYNNYGDEDYSENAYFGTSGVTVDEEALRRLQDCGFVESSCREVLASVGNNFDKALDSLLGMGDSVRKQEGDLFGITGGEELDYVLDEDAATQAIIRESLLSAQQQSNKDKEKEEESGTESSTSSSSSSSSSFRGLTSTGTNLFVGLIAYLRSRLSNYTRYCMICHKKHGCSSEKPVVCCDPLCLFRYTELIPSQKKEIIRESMDKITVCPFTQCEQEAHVSESEAISAVIVGQVLSSSHSSSRNERNHQLLLQMRRHRYLLNEDVLDFLENGVKANGVTIAKIENVIKPELVVEYEAAWAELRQKGDRTVEELRPQMAYHGTSENNIESILEKGLLVPGVGKGLNIQHATDTGYWGKGIYLSPNAGMSVGYCRGGKKLLICSVLMGRPFQCKELIHGQPLKPGYDSHKAPGGQEWIIFNPAQVLPCYLITFA
ncbi:Low molecular weight neuronal intermediate filament [Balamuthia mandrillaris]